MIRQQKRGLGSRWKKVSLLLLAILFMVMGPFVWHIQQLKQAKSIYDVDKVQEELVWIEKKASILKKLAIIKDTKLWLALNTGSQNIDEVELTADQDVDHKFWLYLYYLQDAKQSNAQDVLNKISESSLQSLGKGLMSISEGHVQEAKRILTDTEIDWQSLSVDEQATRHLALAQVGMIGGDYQTARTELQAAQKLAPNNPACLSIAFDLALGEEQWANAIELCQLIDAQTWRQANTLYETKKALLAIHEGNIASLNESLDSLKKLSQGDACIKYVNGIKALNEGDLGEGKNLLGQALKDGLEGEIISDAQSTLDQINERQKADQKLRAVVAKTNEQW